jgi:glycosyltransferase involved in cell wall biosynthesis
MTAPPLFTVFTPTFNRHHTLPRVYESLSSQTYTSFEWIIVDDGSTDGTRDLVRNWEQSAAFPIRYIYQENMGKHRAFNKAVIMANGSLFLTLDSDDSCVPETLEQFAEHWNAIAKEKRASFSGVMVHCMDPSGKIIGNRFPEASIDSLPLEMNRKYDIRGEKWGFHRTDILRQFPFPEFVGEWFIPEGIVWNRIGAAYQMRYVNEALRVYHQTPHGLATQSRRIRIQCPQGTRLYYQEALSRPYRFRTRVKHCLNYIAFSLHANIPFGRLLKDSGCYAMTTIFLPIGYLVYLSDRLIIQGAMGPRKF